MRAPRGGAQRGPRCALAVVVIGTVGFAIGARQAPISPAAADAHDAGPARRRLRAGDRHGPCPGVRIWLGTLLPASNSVFDGTITAPNSERYREQVNAWSRSQQLADGVWTSMRCFGTANPAQLDPRCAGPDHLHPDPLGYQVMADAVSLSMVGSVG